MSSRRFAQSACALCEQIHWEAHMTETSDGLYCERCAALPPYSEPLFVAIISLQRLFRRHFEMTARQCFHCEKPTLTLHEFQGGLVCERCEEELNPSRDDNCSDCGYNPCHCGEDQEPCAECGNPYECVCAELREDAHLARHRRVCGHADCEGDCGTLDCGCVDKCKCDDGCEDDE